MKTTKAALSLLLLGSVSAIAADLPSVNSAAVVAPAPTWTGFYAGLNSGGTWAANNKVNLLQNQVYAASGPLYSTTIFNATITGSLSSISIPVNNSGVYLGGGQIGYNNQIGNKYIIGLEADIQGMVGSSKNLKSQLEAFSYPYYAESVQRYGTQTVRNYFSVIKGLDYIGTARWRLGYLITPSIVIYGTAGLAYGATNMSAFAMQSASNGATYGGGPVGSSISTTRIGWVAGGGFEWMFLNNWSAKAEYLYYDLGSRSVFMGPTVGIWGGSVSIPGVSTGQIFSMSHFNANSHFNGDIVRAGVNYHFNLGSAPVVAKF